MNNLKLKFSKLLHWILLKQLRSWFILRNNRQNLKLHLGCGDVHLKNYINIDSNFTKATDFIADVKKLPCMDNAVERIEAYHLIEHISFPFVRDYINEWYRILQPEGVLIIECPDFDKAVQEYIKGNDEYLYSIYGRQRFVGDAHHWGYNAERLKKILIETGFTKVSEQEPQDYHKDHEPCLRIEAVK